MRCVLVVALLSTACAPALFLPPPSPSRVLPVAWQHHPSGAVITDRQIHLVYRLENKPQSHWVAEWTERVQLRVVAAAGMAFAQHLPPATSDARMLDNAARLTRTDGKTIVVHPPAGSVLQLPDPNEGDVIDIYVRLAADHPQALAPFLLASRAPSVHVKFVLQAPNALQLRVVRGDDQGHVNVPRAADGSYTVDEENLAALPEPSPRLPAPPRLAPWLLAVPQAWSRAGTTPIVWANAWSDVGTYVSEVIKATQAVDPSLSLELAASPALIRERLHAAPSSALLSPWPRPMTALASATPTPLEAAAVLVAATAHTPNPAALVLVADVADMPVLEDVPGLYPWRSALVAFRAGADWRFFDPACAACSPTEVAYRYGGARAVIFAPSGPVLTNVPFAVTLDNQRRYQFEWQLTVDGELTGMVVAELRGESARSVRAGLLAPNAAVARREVARQLLFESSNLQSDPFDEDAQSGDDTHFSVRLNLSAQVARSDRDLRITPDIVAGAGFPWELPDRADTDVVLPGPLVSEVSCTLTAPFGISPRQSAPVSLTSPFGSYEASVRVSENVLIYTRRLRLTTRWVPRAQTDALRNFVRQIHETERAPWVLALDD